MTDVAHYYRILELEPGASLEEIHQGYKDLAIVWHPDRFVQFPRLQQKAHEKMRQINEARDRLRSILTVPPTRTPQPPKTREHGCACAKNRVGHSGRVRVERPKPADYKRTSMPEGCFAKTPQASMKDYIKAMERKQPDPSGWLD